MIISYFSVPEMQFYTLEPAPKILFLTAYASSTDSDELAQSSRIWANFGRTWNLILNFLSLCILVVHILSLKNPSDATLASLSISIYSRWHPRWRQSISLKIV